MPNPTRALKRNDRLTPLQKKYVRDLRAKKIPIRVYRRGRGLSVHNPFLDVQKKAKLGNKKSTKRTPQARDTEDQRNMRSSRVRKKYAKKFLLP